MGTVDYQTLLKKFQVTAGKIPDPAATEDEYELYDIAGRRIKINDVVLSCFEEGFIVGVVIKLNPKTVKLRRTDSSKNWLLNRAYYKKTNDVLVVNGLPGYEVIKNYKQ